MAFSLFALCEGGGFSEKTVPYAAVVAELLCVGEEVGSGSSYMAILSRNLG